ncbi:MAG: helix-turn-helix transcriptional regulator [Oscillospiraceae bacterium]|nr:helix-turn-helix transcriptional regulator [Oscillospiraceae bacterium]
MKNLGEKIAQKRKDAGMTQSEFAEKLAVTRQTVSRWESGTIMPDIDKLSTIAELLNVSCDYLLKDDFMEDPSGDKPFSGKVDRLLAAAEGRLVKLSFFDEEADADLFNAVCRIEEFEGNWMKVSAETRKGHMEKLIPVSSVLSMELVSEAES